MYSKQPINNRHKLNSVVNILKHLFLNICITILPKPFAKKVTPAHLISHQKPWS